MAYGVGAIFVLLGLDLRIGRLGRAREHSPGPRLLQAARVMSLFLLAATLTIACRTGEAVLDDLWWMGVFGIAGLLALELAVALGLRALRGLDAAVRTDNLAAAITAATHVLAVGILVANVFGGRSYAELGIAVISFAIGQLTLFVLLWLFRCLTSYDDREQILTGNVAAALSHGGLTLALAVLIAHATDGEYQGLVASSQAYALALAEGLLVYPIRQIVVQCLILRARPTLLRGELDHAIGERRDVGAGALEGATYLAAALFVRSLG